MATGTADATETPPAEDTGPTKPSALSPIQRERARAGANALILGTAIMIIGIIIWSLRRRMIPADIFRYRFDAWWSSIWITWMIALLLFTFGLVQLYRLLQDYENARWHVIGVVFTGIGSALFAARLAIGAIVTPHIGYRWFLAGGAGGSDWWTVHTSFELAAIGIGTAGIVVLTVAVGLFGESMRATNPFYEGRFGFFRRFLSLSGLALMILMLGILFAVYLLALGFNLPATPFEENPMGGGGSFTFLIVQILGAGTVTWLFLLGVYMRRRVSVAEGIRETAFEVYETDEEDEKRDSTWRWRLRDETGDIVADSPGTYASKDGALTAVDQVKKTVQPAEVLRFADTAFETYRDEIGEWRWRLVHRDGAIIADSVTGYSSHRDVRLAINDLQDNISAAESELYEGENEDGGYRWRLRDGADRVVAVSGEGFASRNDARDTAERVIRHIPEADVFDVGVAAFEVYRGAGDEYRWRLRHRNGSLLAASRGSDSEQHETVDSVEVVKESVPEAETEYEEDADIAPPPEPEPERAGAARTGSAVATGVAAGTGIDILADDLAPEAEGVTDGENGSSVDNEPETAAKPETGRESVDEPTAGPSTEPENTHSGTTGAKPAGEAESKTETGTGSGSNLWWETEGPGEDETNPEPEADPDLSSEVGTERTDAGSNRGSASDPDTVSEAEPELEPDTAVDHGSVEEPSPATESEADSEIEDSTDDQPDDVDTDTEGAERAEPGHGSEGPEPEREAPDGADGASEDGETESADGESETEAGPDHETPNGPSTPGEKPPSDGPDSEAGADEEDEDKTTDDPESDGTRSEG